MSKRKHVLSHRSVSCHVPERLSQLSDIAPILLSGLCYSTYACLSSCRPSAVLLAFSFEHHVNVQLPLLATLLSLLCRGLREKF